MSLLEWKKLAKQKTELGNKINFVHDTILKNQLGEKTSQESFQKAFKPITTKLDEVALRNLNIPRLTKKRGKKLGVPDYGIALEDEDIPDYGLDDFFDEGLVPENKKQIVPKPPTYEESLKDILRVRNKYMLILNISLKNLRICLQNMKKMKRLTMLWMKKTVLI